MTNSVRKATITSIGSCTIILALACVSMPGCIKPEEPMPNYGKGQGSMRGAEVIAPWMPSSDTAFWNLDRDGDGSLKQAEFVASRGNEKAVKKATELFAILDRDRDGRLTLQEFTKRPREARFHEEDTDGDGFLDAKEYVANRRGEAEIRQETDVFALLDQDHDGKLTFAES